MSLSQRVKLPFRSKAVAGEGGSGPGSRKQAEKERYGLVKLTEDKPDEDYTVDIVAVHGLGGHWEKTWTHENGKLWLRDFLPSQLQDANVNARVMSFGYNSDTFTSKAVTGIDQEATILLDRLEGSRESGRAKVRPIIFIAHSLGGLVVKKTIILAWQNYKFYDTLLNSIRACVFLGVPHRGADTAFWASFPANLAKIGMLGSRGNTRYLDALKRSSQIWRDISKQFVMRTVRLEIRTFYETEKLHNMLIVDEDSACLGLPNERPVPLAGSNHTTICRFSSPESQRYEPVWTAIRKLTLKIKHDQPTEAALMSSVPESNDVPFMVPFLRNHDFVNRDEVIDELEERLSSPDRHHRVAITGIGGSGKTQIALEFMYKYKEQHPSTSIFWIYAGNTTTFSQSYSEVAERLDLPGRKDPQANILRIVENHFSHKHRGPWLLVVDNADNKELFFNPQPSDGIQLFTHLPRNANGSIIFTSRDLKTASSLTDSALPISVEKMSLDGARQLLKNSMNLRQCIDQEDVLLEELERLPLAIKQAAAFMMENTMDVRTYLKVFEKESAKLLNEEFHDSRRYQGVTNATMVTWVISFERIKHTDSAAADLLAIMSFYDRQGIPKSLLSHDQDSMFEFEKALGTLKAFSLIQPSNGGETYGMHRLVKMAIIRWLEEYGELQDYGKRAINLMSRAYPDNPDEAWNECTKLLPHAQAVLASEIPSSRDCLERVTLLQRVSRYQIEKGLIAEAKAMRQECLDICMAKLGSTNHTTIDAQLSLAFCLSEIGLDGQAERMLRQAKKTYEDSGEADEKLLNRIRQHLAQCIASKGAEAYEEAEDLIRSFMNSLGMSGYEAGTNDELVALEFLRFVFYSGGKLEDAVEVGSQALVASEKLLGPLHTRTLRIIYNHALSLYDLRRYEEAETLAIRAMNSKLEVYGNDSARSWISAELLGNILFAQDKFGAAVEVETLALEGKEKVLGPMHPDTLESMHNLASDLKNLGRYEEAEKLVNRALTLRLKVLGKNNEKTINSADLLGYILFAQDKFGAAVEVGTLALKGREKVLGPMHPDTLDSVYILALSLLKLGRYEEAENLASRALTSMLEVLGKDNKNTCYSADLLGNIFYAQDKFSAAVEVKTLALEGREKVLGPMHPDTLDSVCNLALSLRGLGRDEEAEKLASRALTSWLEVLGKDDEKTRRSARLLEELLHKQGKEAPRDVIRLCNGIIWRDGKNVTLESCHETSQEYESGEINNQIT